MMGLPASTYCINPHDIQASAIIVIIADWYSKSTRRLGFNAHQPHASHPIACRSMP